MTRLPATSAALHTRLQVASSTSSRGESSNSNDDSRKVRRAGRGAPAPEGSGTCSALGKCAGETCEKGYGPVSRLPCSFLPEDGRGAGGFPIVTFAGLCSLLRQKDNRQEWCD